MATDSRDLAQLRFDYDAHEIAVADAKPLEKHAKVICETQDRVRKTTAEAVLKIGKELTEAHARLANHKNGTFGKWCEDRCGITARTARNAINAYSQFGKAETVSQYIDATSLYLLSAESCPEDIRDEFIQRAESGEQITAKMVKEQLSSDRMPPTFDEKADKLIARIRDLFDKPLPPIVRHSLVAQLRIICEELQDDE